MKASYYDDEMTDRAVEAHRRWVLKQPGYIYDQPNRYETFRDGNMIYIAAYRLLARYRVIQTADGTERLRRLFPAAVGRLKGDQLSRPIKNADAATLQPPEEFSVSERELGIVPAERAQAHRSAN